MSLYRARLMDAGLIRPADYGFVDFELPYRRGYLRDVAELDVAELDVAGLDDADGSGLPGSSDPSPLGL